MSFRKSSRGRITQQPWPSAWRVVEMAPGRSVESGPHVDGARRWGRAPSMDHAWCCRHQPWLLITPLLIGESQMRIEGMGG